MSLFSPYDSVMRAANALGKLEHDMAEEWLRLTATGTPSFTATKQVELIYAESHRNRTAAYDIAVADYRKGTI